jgi:hypothetical protein
MWEHQTTNVYLEAKKRRKDVGSRTLRDREKNKECALHAV